MTNRSSYDCGGFWGDPQGKTRVNWSKDTDVCEAYLIDGEYSQVKKSKWWKMTG